MGLVRNLKLFRAVERFKHDARIDKGDMKKLIPSFVTLSLTAISLFSPAIQGAVSTHPTLALILGGVYAIAKGLAPSPLTK